MRSEELSLLSRPRFALLLPSASEVPLSRTLKTIQRFERLFRAFSQYVNWSYGFACASPAMFAGLLSVSDSGSGFSFLSPLLSSFFPSSARPMDYERRSRFVHCSLERR